MTTLYMEMCLPYRENPWKGITPTEEGEKKDGWKGGGRMGEEGKGKGWREEEGRDKSST